MPYCPHCGTELVPGNKFCTECGAPIEGTQESSSTPSHPVPPVPSLNLRNKSPAFYAVCGIIILCILVSGIYFSGIIPKTPAKPVSTVAAPGISVTPTGYSVISTPANATTMAPAPTATTSRIVDTKRFGSNYERVYSLNQNFSFGQTVTVNQSVETPPLYIKFDLVPVNISRHIMVGIGTHQEHMVNTTVVSPNAWFEVKIYDNTDNHLVQAEGFGKDYSDITNQEFMERQKGNYRIEFSGHEVYADVAVMTGISGAG